MAIEKSHSKVRRVNFFVLGILYFLSGCGQVSVKPTLSSSVGYEALEQLGEIKRVPLHVGIYINPRVRELHFNVEQAVGAVGQTIYTVPAGKVVAAKLIKLATYQYDQISILKDTSNWNGLLLDVDLQKEQPEFVVSTSRRGLTVMYDFTAKVDFRLKASPADAGERVWVGAARVTDEFQTGGLENTGGMIDMSRGISEVVDRVTDQIVADLMNQVRRSESLKNYLKGKS